MVRGIMIQSLILAFMSKETAGGLTVHRSLERIMAIYTRKHRHLTYHTFQRLEYTVANMHSY